MTKERRYVERGEQIIILINTEITPSVTSSLKIYTHIIP